jgi:hypothetical protein
MGMVINIPNRGLSSISSGKRSSCAKLHGGDQVSMLSILARRSEVPNNYFILNNLKNMCEKTRNT